MATGKESPRQKMIGMMYLVLTALLALNVSREILKGFVTVDESLEKSKLVLDENNVRVKKAFEDYVNSGNFEAKPYLLKAIDAQKNIRRVDTYIDSMKLLIVQKTEGMDKKDTSQLRFMDKLDDFDTPTHLLIGSDPAKPNDGKYSAKDLRNEFDELYSNLIMMLDNMQKNTATKIADNDLKTIKQKLATIKPIDRPIKTNGVKMNWELENFYNMPMAAVITNLNKMQVDLKNVESELLHIFSSASSKFVPKFNKLEAKVIAPTAYVLAGQSFKADVVLGASSTDLNNDKMKVLIDAQYDSVNNKLITKGVELPLVNGLGKYELATSGSGTKNLKGVIVYKNPRGEEEYYPFKYDYMVAPPFIAVAADNMNIFYAGIPNPVSVSAAGFSPSQLKVNVSGCGASIKADASGKYVVDATSAGTCIVTVMAQTAEGLKQQGAPKVFRVRGIPPPVIKFGGKLATTNLEFTRAELAMIGGVGAESPGFWFPVNMIVKSFDIDAQGRGSVSVIGSNLTLAAKDALRALTRGQKAYISNVKVQTPTGIVSVPDVLIKVRS